MSGPRFFHLNGGEIPAEWMIRRGRLGVESEDEVLGRLRAKAVEVAPGVHVSLMGAGGRRVGTCDTTGHETFDAAAYWAGEGLNTREIDLHHPRSRATPS